MIFVYVGALIGLVVWGRWLVPGIYREGTRYNGKLDGMEVCFGVFFGAIFGLASILLMGVVGLGVGAVTGKAFPPEYVCQEVQLTSLQDRAGVEGRFFLGSGTIGEEMRYAYYYEVGDGYRLALVDADQAIIYQDDESSPHVNVCQRDHERLLALDFSSDQYDFHVPEGSVLSGYRLDAQ